MRSTILLILSTEDMSNKSLLLFFSLLLTWFSFSQEQKARKIVEILCSDSLAGRGYVNNGVNRAANFLSEEFKKSGLTPYFGDTSYFQPFSFDVNTFPGKMSIVSDDYFFQPGIDYIVDERSGSFHGELFLVDLDTTVLTDKEKLLTQLQKVENGKKNGFLIDLTKISDKNKHFVIQQFNSLSVIGTVVYLTDQKLTWSAAREQAKFPIVYFQKEIFTSSPLTVHIEAELIRKFETKNVIGYLPAKKKKAKTIVFTAHYDHLGAMGTHPNPTYFPGGNDNASGTSMLISIADYFIKNPSQYNLVFIAFAGEEAGLLGSRYFVENNTLNLSDITFLLNLDIMGSGEEGITIVNGTIHQKHFKQIKKINEKEKYLSNIYARGETANSDHYFFHKEGVPAFFIYTMGPNKNYHDVHDTYEELSFAAYDNIVKLLVDFVQTIK